MGNSASRSDDLTLGLSIGFFLGMLFCLLSLVLTGGH